MKPKSPLPGQPLILALFTTFALLIAPGKAAAQWNWVQVANPHWNIYLTDFGYSDFLFDNTPGFEGREYLSGEWGGAVGYTVGSTNVAPQWFEPNFSFPNWTTDSQFGVKTALAATGLNADNLPIAQSVITNSHLEVTLRHEMIDTIIGIPMGQKPASAGGAGLVANSDRYVLKQTCTVKNISGAPISNLQLFQFLHSLHAERGVYDNRVYGGTLSDFSHDVTLAGVDYGAVGAGSSTAGLEDFIGFSATNAPSAFEIGHYGIEGNGIDDHSMGKPSDGVHLSVEDNWQTPPFSTRQGTDDFTPAARWVSGAERWNLGSLAPNASVSMDVVLSLLTGTRVATGVGSSGGCNGSSGVPGGMDYTFDDVSATGSCFVEFARADAAELEVRIVNGEFGAVNFLTPGGPLQLWEVEFSGTNNGAANLNFGYDATILPPGFDETTLCLYQYRNHAWQKLSGTVDTAAHKIAVTVTNLGVFALGVDGFVAPVYTVTGDVSPANSGTVTGAGDYAAGSGITLVATANAGYAFANWTDNGTVVETSPTYSFIANSNSALVANFTLIGEGKVITTTALPANAGIIRGGGAYPTGAIATVVATANYGYKFSKWTVNGKGVGSSRTNSFTVTSNLTMTANFKPVCMLTVSAEPAIGGVAEADKSFDPGDLAVCRAFPEPGYCFVNWTENGIPVSGSATFGTNSSTFSFTIMGSRTLVANFALGNLVTAVVVPVQAGTATGGGVYTPGNPASVSATGKPGYAFDAWTEDGVVVSYDPNYSFTVTTNHLVVANFVAGQTIAATASPTNGGTIFGDGSFTNGAPVSLVATANPGFTFANWTENGVIVGTATNFDLVATSNRTLVANFTSSYSLTTAVAPPGAGVTYGDDVFAVPTTAWMYAVANPGWSFTNWTVNGVEVSVLDYDSILVESNMTVVANFFPNNWPVAAPDSAVRPPNLSVKIKIANLLANDTDADTDPISFVYADSFTTNNIPLTWDGTNIYYPATNANVADQFTYTVTDGRGAYGTGVVDIGIWMNTNSQPAAVTDIQTNRATARFFGVPGFDYVMQRSTDLVHWVNVRTNAAPANGQLAMDDDFSDLEGQHAPPAAYYRLICH